MMNQEFNKIKKLILDFIGKTYGADARKRQVERDGFYTGEEWKDRGELYGHKGLLVMVIEESPLIGDLNAYNDDWVDRQDAFYQTLNDAGYYAELGHTWQFAVYKSRW